LKNTFIKRALFANPVNTKAKYHIKT